jgi:hypothetical protein
MHPVGLRNGSLEELYSLLTIHRVDIERGTPYSGVVHTLLKEPDILLFYRSEGYFLSF